MKNENDGKESGGIKLDLSINLPTLFTIGSMVITSIVYVNNRFADLTTSDVQTNTRLVNIEDRLKTHDSDIATLRAESVTQTAALRTDIRADMRDLKTSLDTLTAKMMGKN